MFIYGLVHPDEPFDIISIRYVGGTNDVKRRLKDHRHQSRVSDACMKWNEGLATWLRGIYDDGKKPLVLVLEECDVSDWTERERAWIDSIRSIHPLLNIRHGQGRDKGFKHSKETRRKIGESNHVALKGRIFTKEHLAKIAEAKRRNKLKKL